MSIEQLKQRYYNLVHAVQSGVGFLISRGSNTGTPKHLRTGVNIAMCAHSALVHLLIKKGICTEEEYFSAVVEMLEQEVERYQAEAEAETGVRITFG